MDDKPTKSIDERFGALSQPDADPDCLYYAITLTADENLKVEFGLQTEWVGWTDETMRHELRKGRIVYADFVRIWQKVRQPYAFIHTPDDLVVFLLAGGNALVKKDLAEAAFAHLIGAEPVASVVGFGWKSSSETVENVEFVGANLKAIRIWSFTFTTYVHGQRAD